MEKYCVYVSQNPKGLLYKGISADLEKRIWYHNNGLSPWTKNKGPWKLISSEAFPSKQAALQREKFFKSGQGREFLKMVIGV